MALLSDIQAQISAEHDVIQSAVMLLGSIKKKLDDAIASNDPAALQALSDAIGIDSKALADAVAANTPAA